MLFALTMNYFLLKGQLVIINILILITKQEELLMKVIVVNPESTAWKLSKQRTCPLQVRKLL